MRFFAFLIVLCVVWFSLTPAYGQTPPVTVLVDGLPVNFDVQPVIRDGRTLVPFRFIAEALRVAVEWDGATRTVIAHDGDIQVTLQIDSKVAYINDQSFPLDTAPILLDSRTLIPARFFAEAFGCSVEWDPAAWKVLIASVPKPMAVLGFYALGDSQTSSWTDLFGATFPAHTRGNTDIVSVLGFGWYTIDHEGNLLTKSGRTAWQRPLGWQSVLAAAHLYSLTTEMTVHETNVGGLLTTVLNNPTAVERLVNQIAYESRYFAGVNLDLEGLGLTEKEEALLLVQQSFTSFVARLSDELRAGGKTLTLTLHPPNSAFRGYDYPALAELADRIVIMAYDYGSRPEPVNRVVRAVEMALVHVPPEKLLLGISLASENPDSLPVKIGIAKRYGLAGIALWRLGLAGEKTWQAIRTTVTPRN